MGTTITIRTPQALHDALQRRAAASGLTVSELVREMLETALADRGFQARAGHLRGRLKLPRRTSEAWRERLRRRNWRP